MHEAVKNENLLSLSVNKIALNKDSLKIFHDLRKWQVKPNMFMSC